MRRKQAWAPAGQRRKPAAIKVEPYTPKRCKHHPKEEAFAVTDSIPLCWTCSTGAATRAKGNDYLDICERAEKTLRRLHRIEEDGVASE